MSAEQPTGAPRAAYASRDFVMVSMTAVRALEGSWAAAGCFQRIAWRAERDGYWTATMQEIADEICVSVRTAKRLTQRLRDLGWVTGERENRWDSTLTWRVLWKSEDGGPGDKLAPEQGATEAPPQGAKSALPSSQTAERTTTTVAADASDGDHRQPVGSGVPSPDTNLSRREEPLVTRSRTSQQAATEPTLDGMPEPAAPVQEEPNPGHLVAAWCSGWTETRGQQPHPSLVKRVAGICRNVAKDCSDRDDWVAAWRAAGAAGRDGRWDIVTQLAAPVPAGRQNHYLALARSGADMTQGGLLGAFLAKPLEGPRAIGSAS